MSIYFRYEKMKSTILAWENERKMKAKLKNERIKVLLTLTQLLFLLLKKFEYECISTFLFWGIAEHIRAEKGTESETLPKQDSKDR